VTRRSLLGGLGAGIVGGAAATFSITPAAASVPRAARDLARGNMTDWSAHVGERFSLAGGGVLRLVAVEPLSSGGRSPSRSQCFAAVFEASGGPAPHGSATYILASASAAPMPLYLGEAAEVRGGKRLVAVFN